MRWLTGPALEILILMRGLKVGDYVKLQKSTLDTHTDESTFDTDPKSWVIVSIDHDPKHPYNLKRQFKTPNYQNDWDQCCGPHHVKAWRRPTK